MSRARIYRQENLKNPSHPPPKQKMVPVYVKTPILHCHFGEMATHDMEPKQKYVYILRKHSREIRECMENGWENVTAKVVKAAIYGFEPARR